MPAPLARLLLLLSVAALPVRAQGAAPVVFRYDADWVGGGRDTPTPDTRDAASRAEFPSDAPCRWLPARRTGAAPNAVQARAATTAEAEALRAQMARIEAFFRTAPQFATPLGLCLQFSNGGWGGGVEGGHALRGTFLIGAWPGEWLVRRAGRLVFDGETRHIVGAVNTMPDDPSNSISDARGSILRADSRVVRPVGTHQGFAVHEGGLLVITSTDRPLFRPASFERLARWVLAELTYREYETRSGNAERSARATAIRRELTAALAARSVEERNRPGCFVADEVEYGSRVSLVVDADDARCTTRMVEPDPDYFDRRLPRSAIQLVTLRSLPAEPPVGGLVGAPSARGKVTWMNQAIFWGTDWAAFREAVVGAR
jgi:hypothetical protein